MIITRKPQRTFNGEEGEKSEGTAGPLYLAQDIDNINHMFDPNFTYPDGSKGGIGPGNLIGEGFVENLPTPERYEGDIATVAGQLQEDYENILSHTTDLNNPHQVQANQVPATAPQGMTGTQVQALINSISTMLTDRYTKAIADGKYASSLEVNADTGVFTMKASDGTVLCTVDTMLEKIAINFEYDSTNQRLVITLKDGSKQYVPLSDFITEFEFISTDDVAFIVENHKVKATVAPKYKEDVEQYAEQASASAENARLYSEQAGEYADEAEEYKDISVAKAEVATAKAESASESATAASESAAEAGSYTDEVKAMRDEAEEFANSAETYSQAAEQSNISANGYASIASGSAISAETFAGLANTSATTATAKAEIATTKANSAVQSANTASSFASVAEEKAAEATEAAESAVGIELTSEAWAVGTKGGVPVGQTEPQYHNSAKYWAEQASHTVTGVSSFAGRTGFVEPQTGDYTAEMVGAATEDYVDTKIQEAIGNAIEAEY